MQNVCSDIPLDALFLIPPLVVMALRLIAMAAARTLRTVWAG